MIAWISPQLDDTTNWRNNDPNKNYTSTKRLRELPPAISSRSTKKAFMITTKFSSGDFALCSPVLFLLRVAFHFHHRPRLLFFARLPSNVLRAPWCESLRRGAMLVFSIPLRNRNPILSVCFEPSGPANTWTSNVTW